MNDDGWINFVLLIGAIAFFLLIRLACKEIGK